MPEHEDEALDRETRRALQDLERVLIEAISSSADAAVALSQLQTRGYSLFLAVDCDGDVPAEPTPLALPPAPPSTAPVFRIDGRDLRFLRSIGIDPTRRTRRRTRRS